MENGSALSNVVTEFSPLAPGILQSALCGAFGSCDIYIRKGLGHKPLQIVVCESISKTIPGQTKYPKRYFPPDEILCGMRAIQKGESVCDNRMRRSKTCC